MGKHHLEAFRQMFSANLKASWFQYRCIHRVEVLYCIWCYIRLHMVFYLVAWVRGFSLVVFPNDTIFFLNKYYFLILQAPVEENSVQNLVAS